MLESLLGGLLVAAFALAVPAAAQASVSINDVAVTETNADGVVATFTVTRSGGILTGPTDVHFATADGSAHAPGDYTALPSGTLKFGSLPLGGTQQQPVQVAVKGDALDEAAETFRLVLSGDEAAGVQGTATIADDDPPPVVAVGNAAAAPEGATATFTIAINTPSGQEVKVGYSTVNVSATAGQDYTARTDTASIPAGSTTADVGVALLDDGDDEAAETFELRLASAVNAGLGNATGTATILDTDQTPPPPASASGSTAASAGSSATTASPPLSSLAIGPPSSTAGSSTGRAATPQLGLSSPRLRRPGTILVTVACPRQASACNGQVTIFSRPNPRSKVKALRKERRLGRGTFKLTGGATRTLQITLSKADRVLLVRAGRMNVRAFAVTANGSGTSGVRRVTGTLIARTTHS